MWIFASAFAGWNTRGFQEPPPPPKKKKEKKKEKTPTIDIGMKNKVICMCVCVFNRFLQNAGAICAYAFIGTAMSTILIGFTMWAAGAMGLCFAFTFLESLIFGAVISATDPVSVLSVFQRLQAHPDLYTLVFGESIFNDAVAIVLFRSLLTFLKKDVTFKLVMFGMLTFVEIFVCSMLICIAYGFIASLAFKTDVVRNKHSPVEASLVVLLARYSFFTAESLG
ncbi:hypothetical protein BSKO_02359 [Bryopsis sp. KO-2023]|nr:hypothetical protein BSKO_02359 [Bryopsis sp. KO-2023]